MKLLWFLFSITAVAALAATAVGAFVPTEWIQRIDTVPIKAALCAAIFLLIINASLIIFNHYYTPPAKKATWRMMMLFAAVGISLTLGSRIALYLEKAELNLELKRAILMNDGAQEARLNVRVTTANSTATKESLEFFWATVFSTLLFLLLFAGEEGIGAVWDLHKRNYR